MPGFIIIRAHRGVKIDPTTGRADPDGALANPFSATYAEGENEEAAALALGGHFVHVYPDEGQESIVYSETDLGVESKYALLVEGRPAPGSEKKIEEPPPPAPAIENFIVVHQNPGQWKFATRITAPSGEAASAAVTAEHKDNTVLEVAPDDGKPSYSYGGAELPIVNADEEP